MTARRLVGILVGTLMLHLTLVGADLTCAKHGDRDAGRPAASSHHSSATHSHASASSHAATTTGSDKAPSSTPVQPECCRAMTSCAVNAASASSARLAELPPVRGVIEPAVMRVPLSAITSPDPPPPKA